MAKPKTKAKRKSAPSQKRPKSKTGAKTSYANPKLLVETAWLEKHLADPNIRIVDCNVVMASKPEGGFEIRSGLADWQVAHIPNSTFIDLLTELSAPHPTLRFMMPTPEQFARVISRHGIGNGHRIVIYSRGVNYWATRLFLMFRAMGYDRVHVLNGGWDKWAAEQRPVTTKPAKWPKAKFITKPRKGHVATKDDVLDALGDKKACIINALHPDVYSGAKPQVGRRGHIAGSVNVFANDLVDPVTKTFLPAPALRKKFAAVGALKAKQVITYCGGGIAATADSFALLLLGHKNVSFYDASMNEWAPDFSLPMETSADPL